MPIYSNLGRVGIGVSGYSGLNNLEIYPQNTFTPSHDKWDVGRDMSFVDDIPTYNGISEGPGGDIFCELEDLLQPLIVGQTYRFEWTLQNVEQGDEGIIGKLEATDILGDLSFVEGTSHLDFVWLTNQAYAPYPYFGSETGDGCFFEIVNMSLKLLTEGISGYSGVQGFGPQPIAEISDATAGTLVDKFNLLLSELKAGGYIQSILTP